MRYLVTGATGFIGRRFIKDLRQPVALAREPRRAAALVGDDCRLHAWDALVGPPPAEVFTEIDAVVHLVGEPIDGGRWSLERKALLHDVRVGGTRHLVDGLRTVASRPRVLVSCSAVGYYGDRGDEILTEESSAGSDFMADLCRDWEAEAARAAEFGIRVVCLRLGVVLGRDGGALKKMLLPFELGLGGRLGSGKQWFPWVHFDDVLGLIHFCAREEAISGPVNAVAPVPATNAEFTKALAAGLHRPAIMAVPAAALKLFIGEMADVLLSSQRVEPRQALDHGYQFTYRRLDAALRAALGSVSHSKTMAALVP